MCLGFLMNFFRNKVLFLKVVLVFDVVFLKFLFIFFRKKSMKFVGLLKMKVCCLSIMLKI